MEEIELGAYPKISVVIPCLNQGQFIESAIISVINQNYPNLELIVMDGGSSDNTLAILEKFNNRITYWVSKPDFGQTSALIEGFSKATGDIFAWLNSDDLYLDNCLFEVAKVFESSNIDMVYGDTIWIDQLGNKIRSQLEIPFNKNLWLFTHNYIPGMSCFWKKEIYLKVGGLDSKYNFAMDADLWLRISHVGNIKHIRKYLSKMRYYETQKNTRFRDLSNQEEVNIRLNEWNGKYPNFYKFKRLLAYSVRVSWKFSSGCYKLGYKKNLSNYKM